MSLLVVVMVKTEGDGSCRGLCSEAAMSASAWLPGEGLALLLVHQVLEPGFRVGSMRLSRPLTLFVPHAPLDKWGWVTDSFVRMNRLRPNISQDPYDVGRAE